MSDKSIHCTLTDHELAAKADQWIDELIASGGKSWTMQVPARPNADPDLIFAELNNRFKKLITERHKGPAWVKASERLPEPDQRVMLYNDGLFLSFFKFWPVGFNGNDEAVFIGMNNKGPYGLDEVTHWAPLPIGRPDESPAEQPVKPTIWDVGNAFQWAAGYGNEKGEQLILSEDGQWMLLCEEGGVTETDELTPADVAELYLLQCPDAAAEQPGKEVAFTEWCINNYRWEFEPYSEEYKWMKGDIYYTTEQIYEAYNQQKEK